MMFEILRSTLIEFGVDVKDFKVDETGKVTFEIDFSEHDKKVAEEKDKRIEELTDELWKMNEDFKKTASENTALQAENDQLYERISDLEFGDNSRIEKLEKENAELDRMRKSWMETAEKWSKLNKDLQDRIDSFEFAINQTAELQDRHQTDCIEINRLNVALEIMIEKYMKLREVHGL